MAKRTHTVRLPLVYVGERASNYASDDLLPIRLVGLDVDVRGQVWTASEALVQTLYCDLSMPEAITRRASMCYQCAVPIYDHKHFWLNRDPTDTEGRFVIGPSHEKCIQNQLLLLEEQSGRSTPVSAYMIDFTPAVALLVRKLALLLPTTDDSWEVNYSPDLPLF